MEAIKLQHLNIHAAVSSSYSLSWSEDDKLAVTTVEGVNILVFDPDPENDKWKFSFKRYNVPLSENDPAARIDIHADDIASAADRLDVYNLVLDAPIVPTLNGLSASPAQPTMAAWSPAGTLPNSRCVLASVDVFGQASAVVPDVAGAHEKIDLTDVWMAACKKDWPEVEDKPSTRLEALLARSMQLRTTVVAWAPRHESDEVTGLVMCQRDGSVVWLEMTRLGAVNVVGVANPALGIATALVALPGRRAIVGGFDGRITLVDDSGAITPLWHDADSVAVSWMHCLWDQQTVVTTKGNFVVVVSLDGSSTVAEGIDALFIGGATVLNDRTIVLATHNGALLMATVSRDDGALTVKIAPITWKDGAPGACGLARSRNAAIWTVLGSHVDCHDCTPTQLTFFHVPALTPDPVAAVISTQSVWWARDQLELLRSLCMYQRTEGSSPLAHLTLPALPTRWDDLSAAQLRVWRWLAMVHIAQETRLAKKDERPITAFPYNKHSPLYKEVLRIEHLLTLDSCCRRTTALIRKADALTPDEKLCLSIMRRFLMSVVEPRAKTETTVTSKTAEVSSEETSSEIAASSSVQPDGPKSESDQSDESGQTKKNGKKSKSASGKKKKFPKVELDTAAEGPAEGDEVLQIEEEREPSANSIGPGPALDRVIETLAMDVTVELPTGETCALCNADASLVSANSSLCAVGHTLPRCSLSLRQLLQVPYLLCARCDLMALADVEASPLCIFCDAPLELLST